MGNLGDKPETHRCPVFWIQWNDWVSSNGCTRIIGWALMQVGEFSPVIPSGQEDVYVIIAVFFFCDLILSTMYCALKNCMHFFY